MAKEDIKVNISVNMTGDIQTFEMIGVNNLDWRKWMMGVKEDVPLINAENRKEFVVPPNELDEFDFQNFMALIEDYPIVQDVIQKEMAQTVPGSFPNYNNQSYRLLTAANAPSTFGQRITQETQSFYDPFPTINPPSYYTHPTQPVNHGFSRGSSDFVGSNSVGFMQSRNNFDLEASICDNQTNQIHIRSIGEKTKRAHKRTKPAKSFNCDICPVTCKTKSALNLHVNVVHKKEKQHRCKTCSKSFGRIGLMKEHEATHLMQEKNFACETCHSKFKTPTSLVTHQKTHQPSRFICYICNKAFKSNYQLREHINVHNGNFEYSCTICEKKCVSVDRLKMHLRSHSKTKFQCEFCDTQLKTIQSHKIHLMKTHSTIDPLLLQKQIQKVSNLMFDFINLEYVPRS